MDAGTINTTRSNFTLPTLPQKPPEPSISARGAASRPGAIPPLASQFGYAPSTSLATPGILPGQGGGGGGGGYVPTSMYARSASQVQDRAVGKIGEWETVVVRPASGSQSSGTSSQNGQKDGPSMLDSSAKAFSDQPQNLMKRKRQEHGDEDEDVQALIRAKERMIPLEDEGEEKLGQNSFPKPSRVPTKVVFKKRKNPRASKIKRLGDDDDDDVEE